MNSEWRSLPVLAEVELPADPAATHAVGVQLGRRLLPGQTVALVGDLGAGKTALSRGLGEGLGVDDPAAICSPTYLLVIEHAGPKPMLHADAYLPQKLVGFLAEGGLDYLLDARAVVVVEWADRILKLLPENALWISIRPTPQGGRRLTFQSRAGMDYPWLPQVVKIPEPG